MTASNINMNKITKKQSKQNKSKRANENDSQFKLLINTKTSKVTRPQFKFIINTKNLTITKFMNKSERTFTINTKKLTISKGFKNKKKGTLSNCLVCKSDVVNGLITPPLTIQDKLIAARISNNDS
ncbi:hypothetical protein CANARDRAFT_107706 [[Candida] arabinofermentans NRRL YB-2248]|uniref:Uncharacterized protein n=1 Tax=[Candida] arabinofermentans NRRL YB-2248 TaxID=983967 RepID=A0A1E4STS8_9ASCO|nr:hypothetical protein CANARDRAFT_107706 [[Candida] arabinofermentans NRRL YB-2248]